MLKVAEQRGFSEGSVEGLPPELVAALDEEIQPSDLEAAGGFPGLELVEESAASWRDGRAGGSVLLAGEEGLGKTAWLSRFLELEEEATRLRLTTRILDRGKLRAWLGGALLSDDGGSMSRNELIEALAAGPRRIVVIERAENLFLATVNGYRALAELGPIIDGTRKQIFWLLTMGGLAWNHLRAAGKELAFLRRQISLENWSEKEIRALVDRRLEQGGFEPRYSDLMGVEGRAEDEKARNRLGKQTFINLLRDFSGGNPRLALHVFVRSLEGADDGSLRVRPFLAPSEEQLSEAGVEGLFLLAAVMRHGALSVTEAAITTDYPKDRVEGLFLRFLDLGTVSEEEGIYQVATSWRATVLRVLRRGNILIS